MLDLNKNRIQIFWKPILVCHSYYFASSINLRLLRFSAKKKRSASISRYNSNNTKYHCGKDRKLKSTKTYDFGLYNDGIDPGDLLAKSWLKKSWNNRRETARKTYMHHQQIRGNYIQI